MGEDTYGKLCRLSAHDETFRRADAREADSVIFRKQISRESAPKRRGPAVALDMDEAGVAAKFQGQTFAVEGIEDESPSSVPVAREGNS